jgi:hypothetical protein
MKRIIYTRADGGISIIIPSPHWKGTMDELAEKNIPEGIDYKIVDASLISSDRTFRNAWEEDNTEAPDAIKVNMTKAREIHMGRIRDVRDKKLVELDKRKYGNEFDAERQTLRDIPSTFDLTSATTADELKTLWPSELSIQ